MLTYLLLMIVEWGVLLWPFFLPLLFIGSGPSRLRIYAVLVIAAFGIMGLVNFPLALYLNFGFVKAFGGEISTGTILFAKYASHIISPLLFIVLIRKFRSNIAAF